MAHVTKKTLRYYDEHGYLKPSFVAESGARYYLDEDFQRLQQIQLLKYLGFSLEEIKELSLGENRSLAESLTLQTGLVEERIEQLKMVKQVLQNTAVQVRNEEKVDWAAIMDSISETGIENSLKTQYLTASNISARINLHRLYSDNKQGWFRWIFEQCRELIDMGPSATERSALIINECEKPAAESESLFQDAVPRANLKKEKKPARKRLKVLELGCGDGSLWRDNHELLPANISVTISDKSEGMLREVKKQLAGDKRFTFRVMDINQLEACSEDMGTSARVKPVAENQDISRMGNQKRVDAVPQYDMIIANHVLFYAIDPDKTLRDIHSMLKPGGVLLGATYGKGHMIEISELAAEFDPKIKLAAENLWEIFGKENGQSLLEKQFTDIEWRQYRDFLYVTRPEDLIDYILSCHGNQNSYLVDKYKEFRQFVRQKVGKGFYVTKDAGIFVARK